jgi:hypothetical protein
MPIVRVLGWFHFFYEFNAPRPCVRTAAVHSETLQMSAYLNQEGNTIEAAPFNFSSSMDGGAEFA